MARYKLRVFIIERLAAYMISPLQGKVGQIAGDAPNRYNNNHI
jgi:hypothetical protein